MSPGSRVRAPQGANLSFLLIIIQMLIFCVYIINETQWREIKNQDVLAPAPAREKAANTGRIHTRAVNQMLLNAVLVVVGA